jgi:hypothetical protein
LLKESCEYRQPPIAVSGRRRPGTRPISPAGKGCDRYDTCSSSHPFNKRRGDVRDDIGISGQHND